MKSPPGRWYHTEHAAAVGQLSDSVVAIAVA
jgi:hypothetical protein